MTVIDGITWYKPTEFANLYGKTRQDVNGLIIRGTISKMTIKGKTHVSGTPPWSWHKVTEGDTPPINWRTLYDKPPYSYMEAYAEYEPGEEPLPKDEPFPGAWMFARKFDRSWREITWIGKQVKNDPRKVFWYLSILTAFDDATDEAEQPGMVTPSKPCNPPEILIDYHFRKHIAELLNKYPPEAVDQLLKGAIA